ncbi:MAG: MFS transporter [Oryzihumus sp.]
MAASPWRPLAPLVLATMASQALLVFLGPTIVAISHDLGASVSAVGQARAVTASVSIAASVVISTRVDRVSVPRMLALGSGLALAACATVAATSTVALFLAAHLLVGVAFALLLSGGFAGLAAFPAERRAWATGYVASANAMAWIVVNPIAAGVTAWVSWRAALAVPAAIAVCALVLARSALPLPARPMPGSLLAPLTEASARRWIAAEVTGYASWTALLTFAGAWFIDGLGVHEATAGWLLAAGAAAYLAAATRSGRLAARMPRRRLVVRSALVMAGLLPVMLNGTRSAWLSVLVFCLLGLAAGVRTPASAGLGLVQLPSRPAAMAAARTGATQTGYLLGALLGGAVIAWSGYRALGLVLGAVMVASAWLAHRVDDREDPAPRARRLTPGPSPGPRRHQGPDRGAYGCSAQDRPWRGARHRDRGRARLPGNPLRGTTFRGEPASPTTACRSLGRLT